MVWNGVKAIGYQYVHVHVFIFVTSGVDFFCFFELSLFMVVNRLIAHLM